MTAAVDEHEPNPKRRKLFSEDSSARPPSNIESAKDLAKVVTFEQDTDLARQNIQKLKSFIFELKQDEQSEIAESRRQALSEFLLSSKNTASGKSRDLFPGLFQTWHFAAQLEHDVLCSSIPATLSLLLSYLSKQLAYRDCGIEICQHVLSDDNVKLLGRNLGSQGSKEHLIEPSLRLLSEIIEFDGGALARVIYRRRFVTLHRIETFLAARKASNLAEGREGRRVSIREIAVRYLLANLKLQDSKGKSFLLSQTPVSRSLLQHLSRDPQWLSKRVFEVLEADVLKDARIDRSIKRRFFNTASLLDLATLYTFNKNDNNKSAWEAESSDLRIQTHNFLLTACSSPAHSLLSPDADANDGDVLVSSEMEKAKEDNDIAPGSKKTADSSSILKRFLDFFHTLRPHADLLQAELIITAFQSHPELVERYFHDKRSFSLDPKLTMTWLGYARFLLAHIQKPVSKALIRQFEAAENSADEVLDHILPQPCTQKSLSKCLKQQHDMITFTAVNILNSACAKFDAVSKVLCQIMPAHDSHSRVSALRVKFSERCPNISYIIGKNSAASQGEPAYRQAIVRLLLNYFRLIPEIALEAKLDTASDLLNALASMNVDKEQKRNDLQRLRQLEAADLLQICGMLPNTQWFSKAATSKLSLFTLLLRYISNVLPSERASWIYLACSIATRHRLFQPSYSAQKVAVLVQAMAEADSHETAIDDFINECTTQVARVPVKYFEKLATLSNEDTSSTLLNQVDLFLVAIWEQWEYLKDNRPEAATTVLKSWIHRYLALFTEHIGASIQISKMIAKMDLKIRENSRNGILEPSSMVWIRRLSPVRPIEHLNGLPLSQEKGEASLTPGRSSAPAVDDLLSSPPPERHDHPELYRWKKVDLPEVFLEGIVGEICLCLCSETLAIRREALTSLKAIQGGLEAYGPSFPEWQQEYLLLLELLETAEKPIIDKPLPYFVGAFAAHCALVLTDPLHFLYVKVNVFLQRGPLWSISGLPKQWIKNIILSEPTESDGYFQEVYWLLDVLLDGLRTAKDVELYQVGHIFEYLFSMCNASGTPDRTFRKVIHILNRSIQIAGRDVLNSKTGAWGWILASQKIHNGRHSEALKALRQRWEAR